MSGYPLARLKYSPASCPTVGQAAALGYAHAACDCAQLCRRCLATQKGTHRPQWGTGWRGAWRGASQLTACTALAYRAYVHAHVCHMCAHAVSVRDTRVHTCALSACVLYHQIPLPVQATCLPPISLCWPGAWQHPWV